MDLLTRLAYEDARERREQRNLSDFALDATRLERLATMPFDKLRAAAALQDHEGELGYVGRCAARELRRRGLRK